MARETTTIAGNVPGKYRKGFHIPVCPMFVEQITGTPGKKDRNVNLPPSWTPLAILSHLLLSGPAPH
jgi:hypothetical protein